MKIGILTEIINSHSGSKAPLEIARHLAKLGHNVTIYAYETMLDQSAYKSLKKNGTKITLIKKPQVQFFGKHLATAKLFSILKKDKLDVVTFSGTLPFFFAAKLTGIPIVRIYMGTQFDALLENTTPGKKIPFWLIILNKIANIYIYLNDFISFRLSNTIVCISRFAKDEGENLYRRKVDKIIYLGTTVLKSFKNRKRTKTIGLICVSRITPYKGFHLIIEALKLLKDPNVTFTIAGSQPKAKYLKYLKRIGGKNLKIVIDPNDRKLAKLYASSDIYVNADRYLYFGLPITEAANFGLPTVSFDFAAAKELVIHGKTGFVAKNPIEFAHYLEKLIYSPKLRTEMGKKAQKRAQEFFSWKKAAKQYFSLFEKLV